MLPKAKIVGEVVKAMDKWFAAQPHPKGDLGKYCVFWAGMTASVLHRYGLKACVNGGTAYWDILPDTGTNLNVFGYKFVWNFQALSLISTGALPEMHAWACVPPQFCPEKRGQIIDLTTRFVPRIAKENGYTVSVQVPEYHWFYLDEPPTNAIYRARLQASHIAHAILERMNDPHRPLAVPMAEEFEE